MGEYVSLEGSLGSGFPQGAGWHGEGWLGRALWQGHSDTGLHWAGLGQAPLPLQLWSV